MPSFDLSLSAAISLVVLMLRGDLRMRMVPDLTRYVPRVLASVTIGTGFALIIDSALDFGTSPARCLSGSLLC